MRIVGKPFDYHRFDIDYEDLPEWVIQKGIVQHFDERDMRKAQEYNDWKQSLIEFYSTIPEQYIVKAIVKGLEYGVAIYEEHFKKCQSKGNCIYNESWERRISILTQMCNELKEKILSEKAENEKPIPEPDDTKNPEFTTARQVMAVHYLLEYCQVKNIDNTVKARFVQFLTGKEAGAKDIKNTTIYKRVSKPFSTDNKTLNTDLAFVRGYFESLGLSEIAKMITNEISQSEK